MKLFNFLRKAKKKETNELTRREFEQRLKSTPHAEMYKALREEGGIVSIKELRETNQLTPEIVDIWKETINKMFLLSLNPEKIRCLHDEKHLFFIPYDQYNSWDKKLKIFLDVLAGLNSLNSFSIVNSIGSLLFLNPLGEPIDQSHDEEIKKMFENFGR